MDAGNTRTHRSTRLAGLYYLVYTPHHIWNRCGHDRGQNAIDPVITQTLAHLLDLRDCHVVAVEIDAAITVNL